MFASILIKENLFPAIWPDASSSGTYLKIFVHMNFWRCAYQGKCYVWKINEEKSELPRYQAVTKFSAHKKYITRVLLSPDVRYLATCSADTTVKIWSLSQNYELKQEKVLQGHQRWVWDCAFSADSAYLVTASSDHTARLWEMASGETVRQYNGHHKGASSFCYQMISSLRRFVQPQCVVRFTMEQADFLSRATETYPWPGGPSSSHRINGYLDMNEVISAIAF
ncbi:WD40-repeat-containing domain protein [Boletus reticuloceps]|uniref:WD40-repeat-containing domain protein n=1 Tax=Boletus reticuloceps TaxID=495285 RepID=A0A8I2YV95_9AGAM|nr:WD40-repeat-containing domain protein [Boletus reticuloceps]